MTKPWVRSSLIGHATILHCHEKGAFICSVKIHGQWYPQNDINLGTLDDRATSATVCSGKSLDTI